MFVILAMIVGTVAVLFSILAAVAASRVGSDESLLDSAQIAWESAMAAVRGPVVQTGSTSILPTWCAHSS